jgi:pantoate--beta-alanine ligase
MKITGNIADTRTARKEMDGSVGFVPTMGYLHEGHLSLVRKAGVENDFVVVSIFVNPAQFGPGEDLAGYPRSLEGDLEILRNEKVHLVFAPTAESMYPEGFSTWVQVEKLTERLEGKSRPGHFRGVATIVAKLFNIVQPHRAYFGEKDAQQLLVIRKMVAELNMSMEIVPMPTVREADGLAISSRNSYLNPKERKAALILWKALNQARELWSGGEQNGERLRNKVTHFILGEPLAKIDYFSIADPETLEELETIDRPALVSIAVRFGRTRLIDNIKLES